MKSYFKHDCDKCTFIGKADINGKKIDFYYCTAPMTIIYRHGNRDGDYGSSPLQYISQSPEASLGLALYAQHIGANRSTGG